MLSLETARSWYPGNDPVHSFDHVERVYRLAENLAKIEGADIEIVRAAALLHDAHGDQSELDRAQPSRLNHHESAAEFARRILQSEGWSEERIIAVLHCIRAHRYRDDREQPRTLEAKVLFDADKLDAIGAIGIARAIAYAVLAGQPIYASPSAEFLNSGRTQPGEAHSAYHEYAFKLSKLRDRLHTPSAREMAESRHQLMVQYFETLADECQAQA
jgi:uncharacterized protein